MVCQYGWRPVVGGCVFIPMWKIPCAESAWRLTDHCGHVCLDRGKPRDVTRRGTTWNVSMREPRTWEHMPSFLAKALKITHGTRRAEESRRRSAVPGRTGACVIRDPDHSPRSRDAKRFFKNWYRSCGSLPILHKYYWTKLLTSRVQVLHIRIFENPCCRYKRLIINEDKQHMSPLFCVTRKCKNTSVSYLKICAI